MNLIPRRYFLDDIFDDFEVKTASNMKCDIYEKDGNYFIEMDVPGFKKEDIDVDIDKGYLTISAKHEENIDEENKNYIRKERTYGSFSRQFYIGNVAEEQVKAEFNNGTLKVVVPKEEEKETKRRIEID